MLYLLGHSSGAMAIVDALLGGLGSLAVAAATITKVPGRAHNVGLTVRTYAERIRILLS
jgi:hypothetical protein